jgi:hypothetical protein
MPIGRQLEDQFWSRAWVPWRCIVEKRPMLTIADRTEAPEIVRLVLAGKMSSNGLGELRREIEEARRRRKQVVLDLSEITLVDRPSVDFLMSQAEAQVRLVNCPPYLSRWIRCV